MNDAFLEAWVNSTHRVLGKRLEPFSLSHAIGLYVINSPYCAIFDPDAEDANVTLSDLELAVAICSKRFDKILDSLRSAEKSFLWRFNNLFLRDATFESEKFEEYLRDFVSLPETFSKEDHEGDVGAPWPLNVGILLSSKGGLDFDKVMSMPIGKAMWMAATVGEQLGSIDILSEFELSIIDEVVKHRNKNG